MFAYSCPACGQRLTATPERGGQKTTCPKCFEQFSIPRPSTGDMEEIITGTGGIDLDESVPLHHAADDLDFTDPIQGDDADIHSSHADIELTPAPVAMTNLHTPTPTPRPRPSYANAHASTVSHANSNTPTTPNRGYTTGSNFATGRATVASMPASLQTMKRSLPMPRDRGMVSLEPTGLASVDLAAELTAAISMRMKPPPDPPADLALSTGGWLLMCAAAVVAWLTGVFFQPNTLPFVAVFGALMLAFGYVWCAYLAGRNNQTRGLLTLLPPVNIYRMTKPFGDNAYRPLRFALTGLLCLAMYWVGLPARAGMQSIYRAFEFERESGGSQESLAIHQKLHNAAENKNWDEVMTWLVNSTLLEYRNDVSEADKPELIAELIRLTRPQTCERSDVRMKALASLLFWSKSDAREATLISMNSQEYFERRHSISLSPNWPDEIMATNVARRMLNRQEESAARDALAKMPHEIAETGLLPLLNADEPIIRLVVAELLEKYGGVRSIEALRKQAAAALNPTSKSIYETHAANIEVRLKKTN